MKRFFLFLMAMIAFLPAFAQQPTPTPAPKTVYIRAGHLFDGTSDNRATTWCGGGGRTDTARLRRQDDVQSQRAQPWLIFRRPPCFRA